MSENEKGSTLGQESADGASSVDYVQLLEAAQPRQAHDAVAARLTDTEPVSRQSEHSLGSFKALAVTEGQFVPMAERHAVEADFSQIDMLKGPLESQFEDFKQEVATGSERVVLREALETLPLEIQETFKAALFATEAAQQYFRGAFKDNEGGEDERKVRRDSTGWLNLDPARADSYQLKKLSEMADEGVCVEYSLLAGEVMRRLGHETAYTVGYRQSYPDQPSTYHAFLTDKDTQVLVDVYSLAETHKRRRPFGLFISEGGGMMQRPDDIVAYKDIFGRADRYSATPIEANDSRQVVA